MEGDSMKEKIRYYLFTFTDAYDDCFGVSHGFMNEIALRSDSFLFPRYNKIHIYKQEITEEEYNKWNEEN